MPWYDGNIPAAWETALERKTGAKIAVEVVLDPAGANLQLTGTHDISSIDEVSIEREMDADYASRGTVPDIKLTFNDPDDYFSTHNTASPFHGAIGELDRAHSAGATSIKILGWADIAFAAGEALVLDDGVNREEITASVFTAASGSTYYHELTYPAGLAHDFAAGTRIFSEPVVGKDVIVKLANYTETTPQKLVVFRGKIVKDPETSNGSGTLTLSDARKLALDSVLSGADSAAGTKLMSIGSDGTLQNSITWSDTFNVAPITYEVSSGALPAGLSIDRDTGAISGTPTTAGTYTFTVRVVNGNGESIDQQVQLIVYARINDQFDSDYGLTDFAQEGTSNGATFSLEDGGEGYLRMGFKQTSSHHSVWDNVIGWDEASDPPVALSIASPGTLTGNWVLRGRINAANFPDHTNDSMVGLFVRDNTTDGFYGYCVGFNFNKLNIAAYDVNNANRIGNQAVYTSDLEFRLRKASNVYSFDYRIPGGSWVNMGSQPGSFTPGHVGMVYFQHGASPQDLEGSVDADYMEFTVGALAVDTAALSTARTGTPYSQILQATGGAGEYEWSLSSGILPSGLELDASTGAITGTPTSDTSKTFTVQVTDGLAATATKELTITINNEADILPDYAISGETSRAYSEDIIAFIGGSLDRSQITVYSGCPLGRWTVEFSAPTIYTITGPSVSATQGYTTTDLDLPGWIKIPAAAWGYGMQAGDTVTFVTGISYEKQNVVSVLYSLLTGKAGIDSKYIDASAYFGDIAIGTLSEAADAGDASFKVAIDVYTPIRLGIVNISDGVNSEDVKVDTLAVKDCYPPVITMTMDTYMMTLANSYSAGAVVTLKQALALDSCFGNISYDVEYLYCQAMGYIISITLEREMSIMQALEAVGAHADIFTFHDLGLECVHAIRPRPAGTPKELTATEIKGDVEVSTEQLVNEVEIKYAYDYAADDYLHSYVYPETDAANKSYQVYGQKIRTTINAPGLYNEYVAKALAQRKYYFWQSGQRLVDLNLDLMGVLYRLGERFQVDVDDPDLEGEFEVTAKRLSCMAPKNVGLRAYDVASLKRFMLVGDGVETGKVVW